MWARLLTAAAGIWLVVASGVLGFSGAAQMNDRIVGPIVASSAVIAIWEIIRAVRWLNLPLGLWLIAAPFVLGYLSPQSRWNSIAVGVVAIALTFVRGKRTHRFGGGWRSLWAPPAD